MTDDAPDSRLHEQRLAAQWAHAYADGTLPVVLDALYAHEINVGMQSFWDNGWEVWIGDGMNGKRAELECYFASKIAPWLIKTAEDHYPLLRQGRLTMSHATLRVPPELMRRALADNPLDDKARSRNHDRVVENALRRMIESLSDNLPEESFTSRTRRGSPHVIFSNGVKTPEGGARQLFDGSIEDASALTLAGIVEYRNSISGPVLLTWRIKPELSRYEGGVSFYTRLCFEMRP